MMGVGFIRKVWHCRWVFRSLPWSIYFNFHYLPWKHALKLPILLYKPKLLKCGGTMRIVSEDIRMGMIILGKNTVSIYSNNGVIWECDGEVVFEGKCYIGNASAISISSTGYVHFGEDFYASTSLKIVSYFEVRFGSNVHIGWDCIVTDTDFHKMVSYKDGKSNKGYGCVEIGRGNWLGMKCIILKNTRTPDFCVVSANSVLNKSYWDLPSHSIIGSDAKIRLIKKEGYYRDFQNDKIEYEKGR